MKTIQPNKTLAEEAFAHLRQAILDNELMPNQLYSATELGLKLGGISRTPVREAAQWLEKAGFVRIEKNRGIRILSSSLDQLIETFQIRLMLEVPLTKQAAMLRTESQLLLLNQCFAQFYACAQSNDVQGTLEADRDYHLAILAIVGNDKANQIINDCRNTVLLSGRSTIPESRDCLSTYQDHVALHEAIQQADVERAGWAMRCHIINTAQLLVTQEAHKRKQWGSVDILSCLEAY